MKRRHGNKIISIQKRIFLIVLLTWMYNYSYAQCPRGLQEVSMPPNNNLELYFPFDNNVDNLGLGNYSTFLSGASFVDAKCNTGLEFNGVDDFLEVTPSLNLLNDFTITAWVKPYSQVDPMGIFSIREQCLSTYRGYSMAEFGILVYNTPGLSQQINVHQDCIGFSGGDRYTNSSILFNNYEDVFVAVTVQNNSSENRQVSLYVNCEEFSTQMTLDFPTSASFSSARDYITTIGASSSVSGYNNSFHGVIDEFRLYTEALDKQSLLDVYFQCLPLKLEVFDDLSCIQDLTFVSLHNTDQGVLYQIVDITHNQLMPDPIEGNCNSIMFEIGPVSEPTAYQIQALNLLSGCMITLDTTFYIEPYEEYIYSYETIYFCEGDTVYLNDIYVNTEVSLIDTIYSLTACDTILTTEFVFIPHFDIDYTYSMCLGDSILFGSQFLYEQGVYDFLNEGCDTLFTLNLLVEDMDTILLTETICVGDSVLFDGIYISDPDIYYSYLINQAGCDSLVVLDLTVSDVLTEDYDISICEGDSVLIADVWYTEEEIFILEMNSVNGCDSIVIVDLNYFPVYYDEIDRSICKGDSINVGGMYYSTEGTYISSLETIDGCDSIISLSIIVDTSIVVSNTLSLCEGDSLLVHGIWVNKSGTYTHTGLSSNGCDSISIVELIFNLNQEYYVEFDICEGDSILIFEDYVMLAGQYINTEVGSNGCDSTIFAQLNVIPYLRDSLDWQICIGDSVFIFDDFVYNTGTYSDTIASSMGCDSIITVNIETVDELNTTIVNYICKGDSIYFDEWLFEEGIYNSSNVSQGGCDSIVAFELLFYNSLNIDDLPDIIVNDEEVIEIDLGVNQVNWSINWLPTEIVSCDTCSLVYLYPNQTTNVHVSLVSNDGCFYQFTFNMEVVKVDVNAIPNIFSPNGDGFNDLFEIGFDAFNEYSIMVYDRWGNLIYSSDGKINKSWDGTYNGVDAAQGVYTYIIGYQGVKDRKYISGDITLVR